MKHMDTQLTDKKPLSCFLSEEIAEQSPSFHHFSQQKLPHYHGTVPSPEVLRTVSVFSPESSPLVSQSPKSESTWSFSPCTPPRPALDHHCMFSLCRDGNIRSLVVADGLVLTGSSNGCVRAWQPLSCFEKGHIQISAGEVRAMLARGDMLFTAHKDHKIRVWRIVTKAGEFSPRKVTTLPKSSPFRLLVPVTNPQQHKDIVSCMACNHSEGILYTGSWDRTVKAWSLSDGKCLDSFTAHNDNVNDMVVNLDGHLFTGSSDGTVKMWSKVCGETFHTLIMTLNFHSFPTNALTLSESSVSDSSFLYSGSSDGLIDFWERQISGGYSRRGCIHAHNFAVLCLAALDDLVISGSADSTIKIWKREEGRGHYCLTVLEGHKGPVKCLAAGFIFVATVKSFLVLSASLDRTFKVWKVEVKPETKNSRLDDFDGISCEKSEYESSSMASPSTAKSTSLPQCLEGYHL